MLGQRPRLDDGPTLTQRCVNIDLLLNQCWASVEDPTSLCNSEAKTTLIIGPAADNASHRVNAFRASFCVI